MSQTLFLIRLYSIVIFTWITFIACSTDDNTMLKVRNPSSLDFAVPPQQVLELFNSYGSDDLYDNVLLRFHKAKLHFELNEYRVGIGLLEENLKKDENHIPTIELLAIGYKQLYEYVNAKFYFNLAIEKGCKKIGIYKQKAQVEFYLKEYQSSLTSIDLVLKKKRTPEHLLFKAKVLIYTKDTFEAMATIKQIRDMGVNNRVLDNLEKSLTPALKE